ncbi:hypothetical protein [Nonomuraea sp. NPDC023979]|uniref:hypothetical protein n=1 Tax=Nonomuraea sp. NPDC023979 TaxID=3154796 RepID=UPI0033E7F5A3
MKRTGIQIENRRVRALRSREHRRHINNLRAGGATAEQIAHAEALFHAQEETRAQRGGSSRVRRQYGPPWQIPATTPKETLVTGFLDDSSEPREQLPRTVDAQFVTYPSPHGQLVQMSINLRPVGRPLSDHGRHDGYRWHNALHLAFATVLGWSPVTRSIIGVERVSDPFTANVEDGPHARSIEEQAAWAIVCDARGRGWYTHQGPGKPLLRQLQTLTADLEVSSRTSEEWRQAAVVGVQCMRALWQNGGGRLAGDMVIGTLAYEAAAAVMPVSA